MSIVSYQDIECSCGHKGKIKLRENDTPYSSNFYMNYSLIDMNGNSYSASESDSWQTIFAHLHPVCPKCGKAIPISSTEGS